LLEVVKVLGGWLFNGIEFDFFAQCLSWRGVPGYKVSDRLYAPQHICQAQKLLIAVKLCHLTKIEFRQAWIR
jgi:hypothetical protein